MTVLKIVIILQVVFYFSTSWANECRALFTALPKSAPNIEYLSRTLPTLNGPQTVKNYVEPLFNDALQSDAAQSAFIVTLDQLKSDGFLANARMIERFGLINSPQAHYTVTFSQLIENLRLILSEQLQSAKKNGQIPKSTLDGIKIGIIFQKEQNFDRNNPDHWISLEPHETIPVGFKLYEGPTLLPGAALWSSLARGHFPALFVLSTEHYFVVSRKSLAHDLLGHVPTYLLNIDYALSYMKVAQTIMQKYRESSAEKGQPSWSFIYKSGLFSRVYVFNEGLTKSREDVILSHRQLFGLPGDSQIPSVGGITYEALVPQSKDLAELSSALKQLIDLTPQVSIPIGGAALVSSTVPTPYSNYINYLAKVVYPRLLGWQKRVPEEAQVPILAKMIGIIRGYHLTMSHMNFDELAAEIFRDEPSLSSPMSHYFSEEAGYFSATKEVVAALGILTPSSFFGSESVLNKFSKKGWNDPPPFSFVRTR